MTLLGALRNLQKQRKKQAAAAQRAQTRRENEMIAKRKKYLPMIRRIAKRYHAKVEVLDTAAYISRGKKGVHVNYGESSAVIIRKCEVAFIERATTHKILKSITSGAHKAKKLREELAEAGEAIKGALGDGSGGMYNDPNFGGAFRGR